jgi:putative flippase GtrA
VAAAATPPVAVAVGVATRAVAAGTAVGVTARRLSVSPGGPRVSTAEGERAGSVSRRWIGYGRSSFRAVVQRVLRSWAARSLQVGALATVLDISVLLVCKKVLKLPTPVGAAIGVAIGSTLAFFLNRRWAFRASGTPVAGQAVKFIISTLIAMSIHAPLVGILADWLDVPVVVAKLIADVLVFSIGQLLAMRFLIFRKSMHESPRQEA